jgi:hypothetical protein
MMTRPCSSATPQQLTGASDERETDWRRARLHGRPSLDYRYEFELPDRAEKWLTAADRNQRQRRIYAPPKSKITLTSSEASR